MLSGTESLRTLTMLVTREVVVAAAARFEIRFDMNCTDTRRNRIPVNRGEEEESSYSELAMSIHTYVVVPKLKL